MWRRTVLPTLLAVLTSTLVTAACTAAGPDTGAVTGTTAGSSPGAATDGRVVVQAGRAEVRAEVADDADERRTGLQRRPSVPVGTGMVFRYDEPVEARFWMYDVQVPLTAVFAREGGVVGVVEMPPCPERDAGECPTYGPDEPFDTVLETAPETLRGQVAEGDRLVVEPPA